MKDYRNLKLSTNNIDTYFPLAKKVEVITEICRQYFFGDLLDIGCGEMPYKNLIFDLGNISTYTGVDIKNDVYQDKIKPDIFWDGKVLPSTNNSFDCSILIEVLEHVPEPVIVLKEIHRVLKKDGNLFLTVPFLWNLHDVPYDEYRYTPFALKRLLKEAGFEIIKMEALGGWHASLASMLALYSRRALSGRKRKWSSILLKPVVSFLHKKDKKMNKTKFTESQMITGIWCVAKAIK